MVLKFSPIPEFSLCATKIFMPNEQHITRYYNYSVLILMMDGILRFGENGKTIELRRGEYYIQRQGLLQTGMPLDTQPIYFFIEFNGAFGEDNNGLPLRGYFDPQKLVALMERCESLHWKHQTNSFMINSQMLRIFSELLEASPVINERANTANLIKSYIKSMYNSQLKLSDIARQFGYTEDYVVRIFRDAYKTTPHKYLVSVRLEHALWLLENTKQSTEQIAAAVGYNDFSSFFRAFRRAYGYSPGAARSISQANKEGKKQSE